MEADEQSSFATAAGIAVGTIDYMSPEQALGMDVDGRSDLFSLGCAMYHLMSTKLPFPGESALDRLGRRISGKPVPITEVLSDLPKGLVQVLEKLLRTSLRIVSRAPARWPRSCRRWDVRGPSRSLRLLPPSPTSRRNRRPRPRLWSRPPAGPMIPPGASRWQTWPNDGPAVPWRQSWRTGHRFRCRIRPGLAPPVSGLIGGDPDGLKSR